MDAPVSVANADRRDLLDPFDQLSLPGSTGAVVWSIARLAMLGKPVECLPASSNAHSPPFAAAGQASKLSADHVLQHRLVKRQIRHDLLQLAVLLFQKAQALHLRPHQAGVLLAPIVKGRLADPSLAADLANRRAFIGLPQDKGNLRLRELRSRPESPMPLNWNFPAIAGPENRGQVTPHRWSSVPGVNLDINPGR
jgi:hypothetical protein